MRPHLLTALLFYQLLALPATAQNVFSEKDFEYKKTLLPYDAAYTIGLDDKQFIMLQEVKKNQMKLGRYDQYFFELWERPIEFDAKESAPKIYVKGDSVVAYSYTLVPDKNLLRLTFIFFDLSSGAELGQTKYEIAVRNDEGFLPHLTFSDSRSKFVVYNFLDQGGDANAAQFSIYEPGVAEPLKKYSLPQDKLTGNVKAKAQLSDNGDLLLAIVDAENFKTGAVFWNSKNGDSSEIESNFFLERPADKIGNIDIVRQGASSYFISFSANIEDELIGFGVLGVNVVLKTVLFAHNQNFTADEINELYDSYYVTSEDQKKKRLEVPSVLNQFRLVGSFKNDGNDIILAFEELELPVSIDHLNTDRNLAWKHKSNEDKFYFGGDVIFYCFSESGQIKWKRTIQKSQFSQANSLGLSFIPRMDKDQLDLLCYESSKGGNFYVLSINTSDGSLAQNVNLLPDKKYEFVRKYSCWLTGHAVVICGVAPTNINKRTLMLVEF
jgi:hypothetical protein